MGMEGGKLRFPWDVEALADCWIRRIIVIDVPFLGHPLKQRIINALRNQEVYGFLKTGNGAADLLIFMSGQGAGSEADGLQSFQIISSRRNYLNLQTHPI